MESCPQGSPGVCRSPGPHPPNHRPARLARPRAPGAHHGCSPPPPRTRTAQGERSVRWPCSSLPTLRVKVAMPEFRSTTKTQRGGPARRFAAGRQTTASCTVSDANGRIVQAGISLDDGRRLVHRGRGIAHTWCSKDTQAMIQAERSAHQQRMGHCPAAREADKAQRQHDAATAAAQRWEAAEPAPADHPYLAKKGVHAHGTRAEGWFLIVPMRDWNQTVEHSASTQRTRGDKKGLPGRRTGLWLWIGKPGAC